MKATNVIQSFLDSLSGKAAFGCFVAIAALAAAASRGAAAELRLRAQCSSAGPVVRLGDVADIEASDAQQAASLAAVELFPAPAASEQRIVGIREIQDLLLLRGVNLAEHQFSGSSQVLIQGPAERRQAAAPQSISAPALQRIKRRIGEALVKYLDQQSAAKQVWAVDFDLTEAQARAFADPVRAIHVSGGRAPWTGMQRFKAAIDDPHEPACATIDANVRIVAPVVVALRMLNRGTIIHEGDVELQNVAAANKQTGALHSVAEAIGRELVRAVPVGAPVAADSLRAPIAVHRGDVVTVYALAGGIRIRTNARARDEGSVGELVAVESLLNRTTYFARVSGTREVEVYARPPHVR